MQHVKTGDIYDNSKVVRVDKGWGLLLEIQSIPVSTPAYVSVCQISNLLHKFFSSFYFLRHFIVSMINFEFMLTTDI